MNMNKVFKIAEREFLDTVKTKAFVISLVITPLIAVGIIFITKMTSKAVEGPREPKKIAVVNHATEINDQLIAAFEGYNRNVEGRQILPEFQEISEGDADKELEALKKALKDGKWDAALYIVPGVIDGESTDEMKSQFITARANVQILEMQGTVSRILNDTVVNERLRRNDLSPELVARLRRWVPVEEVNLSTGEKGGPAMVAVMTPFFFLFLMFAGVFGINQQMLTSVVEEKSSRVMELLLAAVSPLELMTGKILGLAAVGFSLVLFWGGAAFGTAAYKGMSGLLKPELVVYFVIYFILGFLLISAMLAAIGSVCNTVKEAQSLMVPVTMTLIIPMMCWFFITAKPTGTFATVLSFIPPITPMIMMLRLAAEPNLPTIQIVASILLLAATVPVVFWAAAKVFRTGVLMYGKPPSLRELLHWVRQS